MLSNNGLIVKGFFNGMSCILKYASGSAENARGFLSPLYRSFLVFPGLITRIFRQWILSPVFTLQMSLPLLRQPGRSWQKVESAGVLLPFLIYNPKFSREPGLHAFLLTPVNPKYAPRHPGCFFTSILLFHSQLLPGEKSGRSENFTAIS